MYDKVLYIDLDVHHGDGVENAFSFSPKVFTFSMHKQCAGYFPGTGKITDVGHGKGRFYTLNFPLKDGVTDETYVYIFQKYVYYYFLSTYILYAKGRLISDGILTLVPLPKKRCQISLLSRKFE